MPLNLTLAAWEADRAMLANQSIQRSAPLLWRMQKPCLLDETSSRVKLTCHSELWVPCAGRRGLTVLPDR